MKHIDHIFYELFVVVDGEKTVTNYPYEKYIDCYTEYLNNQYHCDCVYIIRHIDYPGRRSSKIIARWCD